jgi:peptidoglycan/LPS O-acetylase OafA/YrhL
MLPRSPTMAWLSAICAIAWSATIIVTGYEPDAHQLGLSGDTIWFRVLVWGVLAFLLVYSAVQLRLTGRIWNAFSYLGDASYSAYLAHGFVMIVFVLLQDIAPPKTIASLAILSSWCFAILVHEGLEKRLLKLFRPTSAAPIKEFLNA